MSSGALPWGQCLEKMVRGCSCLAGRLPGPRSARPTPPVLWGQCPEQMVLCRWRCWDSPPNRDSRVAGDRDRAAEKENAARTGRAVCKAGNVMPGNREKSAGDEKRTEFSGSRTTAKARLGKTRSARRGRSPQKRSETAPSALFSRTKPADLSG
jgi:hypothetical protein